MKLKAKLIIGFGVMMVLMAVMTTIGYNRLNDMNKQLDEIYEQRYLKVRYSSSVRSEVNNISRVLVNVMLNRNASLEDNKNEINAMIDSGNENLQKLIASSKSTEEQQMLTRVRSAWEGFKRYEEKQMSLVSQGMWEAANAYRNTSGLALQEEALKSANELAAFQDMQVDRDITEAKTNYSRSIQITAVLMTARFADWICRHFMGDSKHYQGTARGLHDDRQLRQGTDPDHPPDQSDLQG